MRLDRVIALRNNKTVYRDGDKCIKVFNEEYSKAEVLNEALNQARIEETGLNIPKIVGVTVIDGKWAIVSEFISGKTLSRLMAENPEKKEEYITLFVKLQMQINSKSSPLLSKLKDKMSLKIAATELDATTRYDLHTRIEAMPRHNKVCHGDFTPSNVIITDEGRPYILDWSHATQGNASADVARSYLLFLLRGDVEGAELYLKIFCELSDTDRQYVKKWLPLVSAVQLLNGKAEEKEQLMRWIESADYK